MSNIITIDSNSFLAGMSLSDYYPNGGFSPKSLGFETDRQSNLGLLLPGRGLTDYTTVGGVTFAGGGTTSVKYYKPGYGFVYYLATSGSGGSLYQVLTGTPVTRVLEDSGIGSADCAFMYNNKLYISTYNDIYYDDTSFTIKNKNWWTTTMGQASLTSGVPHKIFDFQGVMYITNGNVICSFNGTTANSAALTIPTGWIITDAITDNDAIYFVASYSTANSSFNPKTKVFGWDTSSPIYWQKEVDVYTGVISSMIKVDVTGKNRSVFIMFASNGGMYMLSEYFSMFTCSWIRNISVSPNYNQIAYANGDIYFATQNGVASYNTHFNTLTQPIYYGTAISCINIGYLDHIDIWDVNGKMLRGDYNNLVGSPLPTLYSNWMDLQNGRINKIVIGFTHALQYSDSFQLDILNESGNSVYTNTFSVGSAGEITALNITNVSHKLPINLAQLKLAYTNISATGIRFIKIFYNPSESYVTQ